MRTTTNPISWRGQMTFIMVPSVFGVDGIIVCIAPTKFLCVREKTMVLIEVPVFSNGDLTKEVYQFELFHNPPYKAHLDYRSYHKYERDTVDDLWANEWAVPLSLDEWVELNMPGWEPRYELDEPHDYTKYYEKATPHSTKDGRPMSIGQYGGKLPIHPSHVRYEAKARLIDILKDMEVG
jgi:hypothetical protein